MKPPIRLLLAATICYYSLSALHWGWSLHADPWRAEDYAAEQAKAHGVDWPQELFCDLGGQQYESRYGADDGSGRYAIVKVKKTEAGWQLVSFEQGTAQWREHDTASR